VVRCCLLLWLWKRSALPENKVCLVCAKHRVAGSALLASSIQSRIVCDLTQLSRRHSKVRCGMQHIGNGNLHVLCERLVGLSNEAQSTFNRFDQTQLI
jgi:hypothetical protein